MGREIVAEIGDDDIVAALQRHNHAREFRGAALFMMPEGLAIGGEQDRAARFMLERDRGDVIGKRLAVVHRIAERNFRRQRAIEAKDRKTKIIALPDEGTGAATVRALATETTLVVGEDSKLQAGLGERQQRRIVDRAFGKPHTIGPMPKTIDEILDTPGDLQLAIARRQQRQYRMVVGLARSHCHDHRERLR